MVGEGIFPKTDGDILYASEVNRFARSPITFYIGSTTLVNFDVLNSGSLLIPAGSMSNPCTIYVDCLHVCLGSQDAPRIMLSGLSNNVTCLITSNAGAPVKTTMNFMAAVGSPGSGWGFMNGFFTTEGDSVPISTRAQYSQHTVANFDPSQPAVLFFQQSGGGPDQANGSAYYNNISVRIQRTAS